MSSLFRSHLRGLVAQFGDLEHKIFLEVGTGAFQVLGGREGGGREEEKEKEEKG